MLAKALLVGFLCGVTGADSRLRGDARGNSMHVLGELGAAERMIQEELRGSPKIMKEEMQLLHTAEGYARGAHSSAHHAAKTAAHGLQLTQRSAQEGLAGRLMGELSTAKLAVEKALQGHPKILQQEEAALKQAEDAAQQMRRPAAHFAALMETAAQQGKKTLAKTEVSVEALEAQRSRSMARALQEERSYATAEDRLAKDEGKAVSEFAQVKDAVAEAFAGKDGSAVKTAMQIGELMDTARDEQKNVAGLNAAEAARAKQDASKQAAALAQISARSKVEQEKRAYTSGMKKLVADGSAILSDFSKVKESVAQAFAGKDSKAVQKAMEVGELLDQARQQQQQVTDRDRKESQMFGKSA